MSESEVLSGSLVEINLPALLISIYRDKESGILSFSNPIYEKRLYLSEGKVIYASSQDPDERLGENLLKRGLITVEQYLKSASLIKPGRRQGEILIDLAYITSDEMVEGVRNQIYDIVYSLFNWRDGHYTLSLEPFSTLDLITINCNMEQLIYNGMSRTDSWLAMWGSLGGLETILDKTENASIIMSRIELSPEETELILHCNGKISVGSLILSSYLSSYQSIKTLWICLTLNIIKKVSISAQTIKKEEPPDFVQMESVGESYNSVFALLYNRMEEVEKERADEAIMQHLLSLSKVYPDFIKDQHPQGHGKLDIETLLCEIGHLPEQNRFSLFVDFLNEYLYGILFYVQKILKPEQMKEINSYIKRELSMKD